MEVGVTDIRDIATSRRTWRDLGLPAGPPADAELVAEINREHSADDVDWPEGYWLSRQGERWILWVFNPDDDHDAGSVFFPGAWTVAAGGKDPAGVARDLLLAYWARVATTQPGSGFEQVLSGGLLPVEEAIALGSSVWPELEPVGDIPDEQLGPTLRAQLCAARLILQTQGRAPYLAEAPDTEGGFLPDVSFASSVLSWGFGEPLTRGSLVWLAPVAEHYLLGVSSAGAGGRSGVIYGCLPGEESEAALPRALAVLFERNGHPAAPLFPEPPVAVMHADNAPAGMAYPALLAEEARALFGRRFDRGDGTFSEWFAQVTAAERIRELGRIVAT